MNSVALDSVSAPTATGLQVVEADRTDPLSKCVQDALRFYLENMAGHDVVNLYALVLEEVERPMFETVLDHTNGNLSHAAKILGLTRATLRKRLAAYGIERAR
ncbi:helix-turn-helix domain-containing protein [Thiocapsa roseopersicina]|uniref:Putative Fis-like DNA-binding protein n=1 Tax=Thiocapsa roseopersicina TaxID=1058 RepID=A0A1H2UNE9_THIRO|nr:helix-turn-helix domain-containing protein [Thiocapsa roseopersicina]SDW57610.1 Fis family transcriptional regulator, factor for inversion stimulation protein [Thiocapsa roseopersicina]